MPNQLRVSIGQESNKGRKAIMKAVHPNPLKRHEEVMEFVFDLRHPNKTFLNKTRPSLKERNPVLFWKCISLTLAIIIITLLVDHPAFQ